MEGGGTATEVKGRMEEEVKRLVRGRDKKGGMKAERATLGLGRHERGRRDRKMRRKSKGRMRGRESVIKEL